MILTYLILVVISWIVSNKLYYIPFSKFYFVILILPALSISMSVMNCNMTPMTRYIILILAVAFYGIEMYMNYKKVKLYLSQNAVYTNFTVIVFLSFSYDFLGHKRGYNLGYYFIYLLLVVVSGFRYRIGADTFAYQDFFEEEQVYLSDLSLADYFSYRWEPLFIFFVALIKSTINDFIFFRQFIQL